MFKILITLAFIMEKTKRKSLTIQQKLEILKEVDNGTKIKELSVRYGVHKSTISKIKKNKENLETYVSSSYQIPKKVLRMKRSKFPEVERTLYSWFLQQRNLKNPVSNGILQLKAKEINAEMGLNNNFLCSDGWLSRFKKRHGIRILTISGEKLSCDDAQISIFCEKFKQIVQENNYLPEQIYNCDETGLVYKGLPNKTNVVRDERSAPGRKAQKERVTLMPCVNATGNHKLQLIMIGKAARPRCFKNITIPLHYRASRHAWQTTLLFREWFTDQYIPEVTAHLNSKNLPVKALLLMDNASCHGTNISMPETENFKILYLPPNMTPYLQPLDQNIIKSFKSRYRKRLLTTLASRNDDVFLALRSINLKDVAYMAVESWNEVPKSVVINAFKHLFSSPEEIMLNLPFNHFDEDDDLPIATLFNSLLPENNASFTDIMEWAAGENENNHVYDLNSATDCVNENECEEECLQIINTPVQLNINIVIDSFNLAIEWSESVNLPVQDLLLLRRIREKAVLEKFK